MLVGGEVFIWETVYLSFGEKKHLKNNIVLIRRVSTNFSGFFEVYSEL